MIKFTLRRLVLGLALLAAAAVIEAREPAKALGILICSFSMTDEAFGSVDVLPGAAISTSAVLTISCGGLSVLQDVSFCVAFPATTLTGPSSLSYVLRGPSPATTPWSSTTPIVFTVPLLGGSKTVPVPATILAGQGSAPPGSYNQTVTATVSFGFTGCTTGSPQTATFTFNASATVLKTCNVSADNLDFGPVGSLASPVPGQGQIHLQCSAGTGYTIALGGGSSGATDPTQRKMVSGVNSVTYGLYRNPGYTLPWGNVPGSNVASGSGTALVQSIPVYGRVPAQTLPPPGTYTDTIVVSVGY